VAGRRNFKRWATKSKDLIWVTTLIRSSNLEFAGADIAELVIPADWSLSAGFDRCTLMGIRGWLGVAQTGSGTASEAPGIWGAIYLTDQSNPANSMDPNNAADYAVFDCLYTFGQTGVGTIGGFSTMGEQTIVKARRKLTSADEIRVAVSVPTDTATPRFNVCGCMRSLLKLDPH